ncbi:MAG: DEAD/DEAH box helicase family protein [Arcobacteraceae bacterium]
MNSVQQQLNLLIEQKISLEKEITKLENILLQQKKEFTKDEKIELFKALFVGRVDIYAKKWISKDLTNERFFPATQTFKGEDYLPLSNEAIEKHLRGQEQLATFSILPGNRTKYLVLKIAEEEAYKVQMALNQQKLKGYFERTSSNDFKVWLFFNSFTEAKKAKDLGEFILQKAQASGEIFPNQEFVNASNLGKYVELPLFLQHRKEHKTVFIDIVTKQPFSNQWAYLNEVVRISSIEVEHLVEQNEVIPSSLEFESIIFPNFEIKIFLYDGVFIHTQNLSKSLLNKLKGFASFENPQIKLLTSLRKPLYNTPKIIKSFEEEGEFLKLPRGVWEKVKELFESNKVSYVLDDRRVSTPNYFPKVVFTLRQEQEDAIERIKAFENAICVAPPGFGKTLIGAKMIEVRQANTLVVVNKNMLLNQWIDRFCEYFNFNKKQIGYLGKGQNTLNGHLDVATMQSLKNAPELIDNYSFIIVDECHHIPAVTFEQIIKAFKGKYVLGLSATPNRKDGLEPILFQQLGEVAYRFKAKKSYGNKVKIVQTFFQSNADNYAALINEICIDTKRNQQILKEIVLYQNRTILVLTDRLEHIRELEMLLDEEKIEYISVHGNLNKKEQNNNMNKVQSSKLILATTSFFGEGIDFPHLNTIIFATPISYYGRLIQYLGRIGRNGQACLAIDFLDSKNAMLNSAYKKRKEGYTQMHYSLLGSN